MNEEDERVEKIPLSGKKGLGLFVLVDRDDYEKVGGKKWHLSSYGYAVRTEYKDGKISKRLYMHRVIMGCPDGMVVDHKNGNKLDNRKSNLRICTDAENHRNRHDNPKYYYYDSIKKRWRVVIGSKHYGSYKTEDEARRVARIVRSGGTVPLTSRKYRLLPKNIYRNNGGYMFRKKINGVEIYKGGFKTISDAKKYSESY